MKTTVLATASTLAMIATAAAHPGHDHSNLSTPEFAWHHLLTGGFVGVATVSVAWFGYHAFKKRREVAAERIKKH
ncbi:hypothetical protein ACFQY0_17950 [Haloferula chungangensis]|uniref:Uncharacterized protein n=1 Tax=Haloferula chungangensis TaxID=1048331 RepID=A0ABW2LE76_9BACT